jgi:hypothetical protein
MNAKSRVIVLLRQKISPLQKKSNPNCHPFLPARRQYFSPSPGAKRRAMAANDKEQTEGERSLGK